MGNLRAWSGRNGHPLGILVAGAVLAGLVLGVLISATTGREAHRIHRYAVDIAVQADGSAQVRETIDYDFARNSARGFTREFAKDTEIVLDDDPSGEGEVIVDRVRARAAEASADIESYGDGIRIGDVTTDDPGGRHRYVLEYRVRQPHNPRPEQLDLRPVEPRWDVPIDTADIRIAAAKELRDPRCTVDGEEGRRACPAPRGEGNSLRVHVDELDEGEGVQIQALLGKEDGAATLGPAPDLTEGADTDNGPRALWWILGAGSVAYLLGAIWGATSSVRAKRAHVSSDGKRMWLRDADRLVQVQSTPPIDLPPAHGVILLKHFVGSSAIATWFVQQAYEGKIAIANGNELYLNAATSENAPGPLRSLFAAEPKHVLQSRDERFRDTWRAAQKELTEWKASSGHFRRTSERGGGAGLGCLAVLVALAAWFGLWHYGRSELFQGGALYASVAIAGVSALLVGAAFGRGFNSRVDSLSPSGFALRQQVEGFRRFLFDCGPDDVRRVAAQGQLALYTLWAFAFGYPDRWRYAVEGARVDASVPGVGGVVQIVEFERAAEGAVEVRARSG